MRTRSRLLQACSSLKMMAMVRTSLQKVVVFLHRLQRMAISSPRYQKLCKVRGLQDRERERVRWRTEFLYLDGNVEIRWKYSHMQTFYCYCIFGVWLLDFFESWLWVCVMAFARSLSFSFSFRKCHQVVCRSLIRCLSSIFFFVLFFISHLVVKTVCAMFFSGSYHLHILKLEQKNIIFIKNI